MSYGIRFSEDAALHLRLFSARDRGIVVKRLEEALSQEPTRETRNLKVLRPNPLAKYELRIGSFLVFFDVTEEDHDVLVLAIGRKDGNQLRIGEREVRL